MSEREEGRTIADRALPRQVRVLDDTTVNQIAAGEVVERPASVVKELVENSIDAGAQSITVSIANGGRSAIEVRDDGCGMSRHDALLAIERFGTSKITSVNDLFSVATHGFRGEALPSIAAVSRFTLTTCEQGQEIGTELSIDGGRLGGVVQRAMTPGTVIQVRNLFYNVPARRAFLRSERTEEGLIRSLFIDFAAAYPQIRFRLLCDGSEVLLFPSEQGPASEGAAEDGSAARGFFERVHALRLGAGLRLEDVLRAPEGEYRVRGVLSRPLDAVSGSGRLRLLVNGRSVRDRLLLRAVRNGYGNFLKADRYPTGVVCVEVPPSEVDVNVHPQKTEIRFRTPDKIFTLLHRAVSDALARAEFLAPQSPFATSQGGSFKAPLGFVPYERGPIVFTSGQKSSEEATVETTTLVGTQQRAELRSRPGAEEGNREPGVEKALTGGVPLEQELSQSIPASSMGRSLGDPSLRSATPLQPQQMRYLGQIFRCYLLFEQGEQMVIVDMHAAHERVRFYQLKKQFLSGAIVQQLLAIPEVVELPPDQRERFLECEGDLSRLGMQCELFGEHQVAIRSTPALLRGVSPRLLLLDLLSLDESESWGGAVERVFDAVIARMACHSSVRSGQELTPQEAYALLDALNEAERSAFCPHGRPVVSALSKYELELRFGRRE